MIRVMMLLALLGLAACDDPPTARRALENMGFTDIEAGGYAAFMCGKNDNYSTKFRAKNVQGRIVEGAVCSSWSKGATVRFY